MSAGNLAVSCGALIFGLRARPEYNGCFCVLELLDGDGRWRVRLKTGDFKGTLRLQPGNLCLMNSSEERSTALARQVLVQNVMLARSLARCFDDDAGIELGVAAYLTLRESLLACCSSDVCLYRFRARRWRLHCTIDARDGAGVCSAFGGSVVVAGGVAIGGGSDAMTSVMSLDPITGACSSLPPLRSARHCCTTALINGQLFVVGGGRNELNRVRSRLRVALSQHLEDPSLVAEEDRALVEEQMANPGLQGLECASTCEVLSVAPAVDRAWTPVPAPSDVALAILSAAGRIGDCLVVAGGEDEGGPSESCWSYSLLGGIWEAAPSLPEPRSACGFCLHPRLGLVLAGGRGAAGTPLRTVVAMRSQGEGWQHLAPLNLPRIGGALTLVDGKLLAVGGCDEVEQYCEAQGRWLIRPDMNLPNASSLRYALSVPAAALD